MAGQERHASRKVRAGKIEGNLIEYPLFNFHRGKRTAMTFVYQDESRPGLTRRLTVTNGLGLAGALGQDCLVALMLLREEQEHHDVHFYIREVARLIFGREPSQDKKHRVKESLERLAYTVLGFEDAFFDAEDGEYITTKIKPLFEESTLYQHRRGQNHMDAWRTNVFRLSSVIEKNIAGRYFNYVVFEEYRKLPSGLPRRLFLYLTKKSNGGRRKSFTIGVEKLYNRLPITNKQPSRRFDCLDKTAKALEKIGITHTYNGHTVTFVYPDRVRKTIETANVGRVRLSDTVEGQVRPVPGPGTAKPVPTVEPAGLDQSLREMVAYFYRAINVAPISARRMSLGLQVLSRILAESGMGLSKLRRVIDWALARREKFKGLHSIRILEAVWDQALAEIEREDRAAAQVADQVRKAREVEEKAASASRAKKECLATMRAALSEAERAVMLAEAVHRFETDSRYAFSLEMFKEGETFCGMTRDEYIDLIEDEILLERSAKGSATVSS